MSERYSRLYSLPERLYANGAPVIIAAGVLLKDNTTGKILVQLKLHSISPKKIKAVTVEIAPKDITGNPLGNSIEHQYLDLAVIRNWDFAQKKPIILPDNTTRGFSAIVTKVIFEDNSIWQASGNEWTTLPAPVLLESKLGDPELVKEYRLQVGEDSRYLPEAYEELWLCTCGTLNHQAEKGCFKCQRQKEALLTLEISEVTAQMRKRLKAEAEAAEAARLAAAEEAEQQRIRRAKNVKTAAIIAIVLLLLGAVVTWFATAHLRVKKEAKAYADAGDYMAAVATLDAFGKPEKTGADREQYVSAMESEIQNAIKGADYSTAMELIEKYSVLDTAEENIAEVQSLCPHDKHMDEHLDCTCTENGYDRETCDVCGHIKETAIKAPGHKNEANVLVAPTCTAEGEVVNTCTICGHAETEPVPVVPHNYATVIAKAATCTASGNATHTCSDCGDSYVEELSALGHSYSGATCTKASSCTRCGTQERGALGHTTSTGICSRCKADFRKTYVFRGTTSHYKYSGEPLYYVNLPDSFFDGPYSVTIEDLVYPEIVGSISTFGIYATADGGSYIDGAIVGGPKKTIYGNKRFSHVSIEGHTGYSSWVLTIAPA